MGAIASQITSLTIVYSIVYSDADQRKHQSSASLAFVRGIHRGPVNSPHKWPVTRQMFPFDDIIMWVFHWMMGRHLYVRKYVVMAMCVQENIMTRHVITFLYIAVMFALCLCVQFVWPFSWLCFYQRVLTDPPRIILCLIPFFILSNRISAIFDPAPDPNGISAEPPPRVG